MKTPIVLASLSLAAVLLMSPAARAELIAYEGFGYPAGYLGIADGGDNAGDPTLDVGVFDHLDDGTSAVDPNTGLQPTVLGDPGRNGGDGTWVTSWTRRTVGHEQPANQIDDTKTLSYTDSQGNSLVTTLGQPVLIRTGGNMWRAFDASSLGSGLTMPNNDDATYDVPRLGKQDTTIWMSFLGDRSAADATGGWFVGMQFMDKQFQEGSQPERTGGIFRGGEDEWLMWDAPRGADPIGGDFPNGQNIIGSAAADDDGSNGDLFIVVKLDYSATADSGTITDGYADVSIFVDPDLGSTEPTNPTLTASTYTAFNGLLLVSNAPGNVETTSSIDEIRFGTEYGDVAPIAGGNTGTGPGDFAGDGIVEGADLTLLLDNWNKPAEAAWVTDRPSPEGANVAGDELTALLDNWNTNYTSGSFAAATIPEPSTMAIALLASMVGLAGRRIR